MEFQQYLNDNISEFNSYVSKSSTVTCVAALIMAKCSFSAAGCKIFAPECLGV